MRSFAIGTHKVTQQEFDGEVARLYKLGLDIGNYDRATGKGSGISLRLRRERTSIWRALQRSGTPDNLAAKQERAYHQETNDEFLTEGVIKEWTDDMKVRRVKDWKSNAYFVKKVCDELQIFPDQLDIEWGKKWLATKSGVSLEKLRAPKVALRGFFKSQGVNDYDLTQAGFDAKHYGVGKWKHVKLSEGQIARVEQSLRVNASPEALFVFKFGIETCRTLEPIWGLKGEQFYTLETPGKVLYACNIFRKKTEKSGAAYKTAYVSQETYTQAKALSEKNGGTIMDGKKPEDIYPELKAAYRDAEITGEYFFIHPIHALRHSGAQRLLEKTQFNRAVVAELGGWEAEKTLEDHYGGVPVDIVRSVAGSLL